MTDTGPHLYEINARIDHAAVVPLIDFCWALDMVAESLKVAVGIPLDPSTYSETPQCATTTSILSAEPAILDKLELPSADPEKGITILAEKNVGDLVHGPEGSYDSIATFVVYGDDVSTVEAIQDQLLTSSVVELTPVDITTVDMS